MVLDLINKLLLLAYVMSILNVIRHSFYFGQAMLFSTEEEPKTYKLDKLPLILLGVSLSYIIVGLISGYAIK